MKTLFALTLGAALLVLGCENPRSSVTVPTATPRLAVANAPAGAVLFVDGKAMGEARLYNGDPGVLALETGTHLVEVRQGDKLLLSTKVFFGGAELRTVTL